MAKISWDNVGEKLWETGVDHGVIYIPTAHGVYGGGVPWNGLISVTEKPTGAEPNDQYADNIKYLTIYSKEDYESTIEAFTYPPEFAECNGAKFVSNGVSIHQQARKPFGFSYRTIVGNDTENEEYGYKLHLVYGCMAKPTEQGHQTINDSPEAMSMSWDLTTIPVPVPGMRPTAHICIDSTLEDETRIANLEKVLYGDDTNEPRLPTPEEVMAMFTAPDGGSTYVSPREKARMAAETYEASMNNDSRMVKSQSWSPET